MKRQIFTLLLLFTGLPAFSQNLKHDLDSMLVNYVNDNQLHGCVTYVQQGNTVLHFESYGYQNIELKRKMTNDVIFDITSISKIITAAGALKLWEEGRFLLDDPVKKFLPQFNNLKVMVNMGTDSCRIVPTERDVTIRDLCRHTAGFGYGWGSDTIDYLYRLKRIDAAGQTRESYLNALCSIPLKFQPGSKWEYSCSIDILGFLIEEITQISLQEYLTKEFFIPLKMKHTGFYINEKDIDKLSAHYSYSGGMLKQDEYPLPVQYLQVPAAFRGGGGIVSKASDLANFFTMILNYGDFKGRQILQSGTVELLISDQIGEIKDRSFDVPGYGFGVGVYSDKNSGKTRSVYWQGSPFNTCFFIDFEKNLVAVFLTQNGPFGHLDIINRFTEIVEGNVF